MILLKFKETTEDEIQFEDIGRRSWRWVLDASISKSGMSFGLQEQIKFQDNNWCHGKRYLTANLTPYFTFGSSHNYYDGPNCAFSIGFLHFTWSLNDCKECMNDF